MLLPSIGDQQLKRSACNRHLCRWFDAFVHLLCCGDCCFQRLLLDVKHLLRYGLGCRGDCCFQRLLLYLKHLLRYGLGCCGDCCFQRLLLDVKHLLRYGLGCCGDCCFQRLLLYLKHLLRYGLGHMLRHLYHCWLLHLVLSLPPDEQVIVERLQSRCMDVG